VFATNFGPPGGTLAGVMGKKVLRYAVMLPGILYLWALLPVSFRPQYTGSPFRKPDPTVNVDVSAAKAAGVATATVTALAETGLTKLSNSRLKQACEPPTLLKPIVRPAQRVVVRYLDNGKVVAEKIFDCSNFV
jgi:hypothetical protein